MGVLNKRVGGPGDDLLPQAPKRDTYLIKYSAHQLVDHVLESPWGCCFITLSACLGALIVLFAVIWHCAFAEIVPKVPSTRSDLIPRLLPAVACAEALPREITPRTYPQLRQAETDGLMIAGVSRLGRPKPFGCTL
jgi:hypothetical protein